MLSAVNSNTNYNPSFGQVNLVRVSKKAFSKPEDLKACSREFGRALDKASGNIFGVFDNVLALIGLGKLAKTTHFLSGFKGVNIFGKPAAEGEHVFCVLTGADKNTAASMSTIRSAIRLTKEYITKCGSVARVPENPAKREVGIGELLSEKVRAAINVENPIEFKIENLQELLNLKAKLGL